MRNKKVLIGQYDNEYIIMLDIVANKNDINFKYRVYEPIVTSDGNLENIILQDFELKSDKEKIKILKNLNCKYYEVHKKILEDLSNVNTRDFLIKSVTGVDDFLGAFKLYDYDKNDVYFKEIPTEDYSTGHIDCISHEFVDFMDFLKRITEGEKLSEKTVSTIYKMVSDEVCSYNQRFLKMGNHDNFHSEWIYNWIENKYEKDYD